MENNLTITNKTYTERLDITGVTNLRITDCKFINHADVGIWLSKCINVTIENCYFENVASGVIASTCTGVYINNNQFLNMRGPLPRGQFIQLIDCYGKGNKVTFNKCENIMGKSNPEDAINIYQSNGTQRSPITVAYNKITGGGPSKTGGGICLGDGGGSWQLAQENTLTDPGQYGIGIAGGTNMSIIGNIIRAKQQPFTNVGILAWNQYPLASGKVRIENNDVEFVAAGGYNNPFWDGGNMGMIAGLNANSFVW